MFYAGTQYKRKLKARVSLVSNISATYNSLDVPN